MRRLPFKLLLFLCLLLGLAVLPIFKTLSWSEDHGEIPTNCPPCELHFGKLEPISGNQRTQVVALRERGEPKSGTGFMFEWAAGALFHFCDYLKMYFGKESCVVDIEMNQGVEIPDLKSCTMTFEPRRAPQGSARCPCKEVERVQVSINRGGKHSLPVDTNCSFTHSSGMAFTKRHPCLFANGTKPQDYGDIWRCMKENECLIDTKGELQMAVFRDPRAVAVSTYFFKRIYEKIGRNGRARTVDEFALEIISSISKWTAVRFILFGEYLADTSTSFWYEEAKADPEKWHRSWLASVGLNLPGSRIKKATKAAMKGDFKFWTKGIDTHVGSTNTSPSRSFKQELKHPETLAAMNSIVRHWLPPILLERISL